MASPRQPGRVLVVDDEERIRTILALILRDAGYAAETARDGAEAIEKSLSFEPQVLIVDLQMPRLDGVETILRVKERFPRAVGVILTAHGTVQSAVQAIRQGVYDYLLKPFDNEQILLVVRRALEVYRLTEEVDGLRKELREKYGLENILGASPVMQTVRQQIARIAGADATVLIEGESGTGKELAARAIHYESARKSRPLIIVNCGSIPAGLIESEFFGHERGAFTDARERTAGKFEEADTGSLFLDEIGDLPPDAQTKLLRVLQEKEFNRVGSAESLKVDVRVIAATNKDLHSQTAAGKFREDLYYRLNVLKLRMPALREHREDIPLYARQLLKKHRPAGSSAGGFSAEALDLLGRRDWKGNVRELENTVQRALLNARDETIEATDLDFLDHEAARTMPDFDPAAGLEAYMNAVREKSEREIILKMLGETGWNRTEAAARLKVSRKTLFNKMRQFGLGGL